jgi:hypothetical protein
MVLGWIDAARLALLDDAQFQSRVTHLSPSSRDRPLRMASGSGRT